jgi:hypothetical protein
MSNQRISQCGVKFLSEYTDGKRQFNASEIYGGLRMIAILEASLFSEESNLPDQDIDRSVYDVFNLLVESDSNESEDDSAETSTQSTEDNSESSSQAVVESEKTRKTRSVWTKEFIAEFKPELRNFFKATKQISQNGVFEFFELNFGNKLKDSDKLKEGKGREFWKNKLADNIHSWFAKQEKCLRYVDGVYYYNEPVQNLQTSMEM